ncbi:hypothetical protein M8494_08730 [Serratia ureilytica]
MALDYADKNAALAFADRIDPQDCRLKVGKCSRCLGRSWCAICTGAVSTCFST